jgi:hypothetical protein
MKRSLARLLVATVAALSLLTTFRGTAFAQAGQFVGEPTCRDIGTRSSAPARSPALAARPSRSWCRHRYRDRRVHQPGRQRCAGAELLYYGHRDQWTLPDAQEWPGPVHREVEHAHGSTGSCPNPMWTATVTDVTFGPATLTLLEDSNVSDTITVPVT